MRTNEIAERVKFMECRISGQPYKFVMQLQHPQCLFQVLEFKDMDQFWKFCEANTGDKGMPFTQVGSRMVALRLSCAIQFVEFGQDNASEVAKMLTDVEVEAAKWYNEFLNNQQ